MYLIKGIFVVPHETFNNWQVITGDEVHDDIENYSLHSEDEADTQDNDPIQAWTD